MISVKKCIFVVMFLGLSGCGLFYPVSLDEMLSPPETVPLPETTYSVKEVRVSVPETLVVSEDSVYYRTADIVWRGEPYGDRHQQVGEIFKDGMTRALRALNGPREIYVDVEVTRFHALTNKARYTVGGVHSIKFILTLRDVETDLVIGEPRLIKADLIALGGARALAAEQRGLSQKRRINSHLAGVIQREVITEKTDQEVAALSGFAPN